MLSFHRRRLLDTAHRCAVARTCPNNMANGTVSISVSPAGKKAGFGRKSMTIFAQDPDMTAVMLDSTAVRAHMCAAGGSKKTVDRRNRPLGRSRAGFSSKIHIVADARGHPLRFSLTGAERHDVTQAEPLLATFAI